MELSKEVYGLIEHIQKLSSQTPQKNDNSYRKIATPGPKNLYVSNSAADVIFNFEELIPVESMDFSDDERWLYVSENPSLFAFTGDLKQWLRQDVYNQNGAYFRPPLQTDSEKQDTKKYIDTRTYTRPKKRSPRPGLENVVDGYFLHNRSSSDSCQLSDSKSISDYTSLESSCPTTDSQYSLTTPLHFKLSEPVYNNSFDRILATASDSIDSFQNMSPPSLMNSLCSSTFTTLMDSGYVNQENVPSENNEIYTSVTNGTSNENVDLNITYSAGDFQKPIVPERYSKPLQNASLNNTYDMKNKFNSVEYSNSTFSISPDADLNTTYKKNINNKAVDDIYNLSGTNTYTKRPKGSNITNDLNRTFKKNYDFSFDRTFQKLSDSQPNLTENLKQTILNQSMELMNPTMDSYRSTKSGSADSLDERSSSISDSSKGSGTKIMNMSDLDNLARMQEQSLQQVMSTPKVNKQHLTMWEGDISPIQNRLIEEEYLSDSDMSDSCVTARSGSSKRSSSSLSLKSSPIKRSLESIAKTDLNTTRSMPNTSEVSQSTLRTVPTMVVKPLEIKRHIVHQQPLPVQGVVRPRLRVSGLPRPTGITGIPRPTSRIPGPKTSRPQSSRPSQRPSTKADWMDGCY